MMIFQVFTLPKELLSEVNTKLRKECTEDMKINWLPVKGIAVVRIEVPRSIRRAKSLLEHCCEWQTSDFVRVKCVKAINDSANKSQIFKLIERESENEWYERHWVGWARVGKCLHSETNWTMLPAMHINVFVALWIWILVNSVHSANSSLCVFARI